jgi:hypothetical protein
MAPASEFDVERRLRGGGTFEGESKRAKPMTMKVFISSVRVGIGTFDS